MAETNITEPAEITPAQTEPTQPQPAPSTEPKNLSFNELLASNKDYQSEYDRLVAKALKTAKEKWEQDKIDEQDEAKKLEKMTAAQRESYLLAKDKEQFAKDKAAFNAERMKVACANELVKRGLDSSFADYLTAETAEKTNERLDAFEKAFTDAVSKATNNKMRGGNPPKEPNKAEPEDPFLKGFSAK